MRVGDGRRAGSPPGTAQLLLPAPGQATPVLRAQTRVTLADASARQREVLAGQPLLLVFPAPHFCSPGLENISCSRTRHPAGFKARSSRKGVRSELQATHTALRMKRWDQRPRADGVQ